VSDQAGAALHQDLSLVNAWGLAALPTSPWWVSDNGTDLTTVYRADGTKALTVSAKNAPTGLVANSGSTFVVTGASGVTGPARFIFSTEEGTILGWNGGTAAVLAAQGQTVGAIYKGLALANGMLYATDFHNGRVDVFDGQFHPVDTPGGFLDSQLPAGYAPFGIQNVGGTIVVTYAQQDGDAEDDVAGQGHGWVDLFDTNGNLIVTVARHGQLNSPWGIAMAPPNFGAFSGDLLIGNFGDGRINAYEPQPDGTFELVGPLRTADNRRVAIPGLWALQFGHGASNNGPITTLFFTAGPDHESHGLFGTITAN
jgi:uncharacterized protein (TIGR03118 family)